MREVEYATAGWSKDKGEHARNFVIDPTPASFPSQWKTKAFTFWTRTLLEIDDRVEGLSYGFGDGLDCNDGLGWGEAYSEDITATSHNWICIKIPDGRGDHGGISDESKNEERAWKEKQENIILFRSSIHLIRSITHLLWEEKPTNHERKPPQRRSPPNGEERGKQHLVGDK